MNDHHPTTPGRRGNESPMIVDRPPTEWLKRQATPSTDENDSYNANSMQKETGKSKISIFKGTFHNRQDRDSSTSTPRPSVSSYHLFHARMQARRTPGKSPSLGHRTLPFLFRKGRGNEEHSDSSPASATV